MEAGNEGVVRNGFGESINGNKWIFADVAQKWTELADKFKIPEIEKLKIVTNRHSELTGKMWVI